MKMKIDYVIIGAGPAGLQLGYFLEKARKSYLILEKADRTGSFFATYPRHRKLLSINKVNTGFEDREMNLRWDWNSLLNEDLFFREFSEKYFPDADDLCAYLEAFSSNHGLKINYGIEVVNIEKTGNEFQIKDSENNIYKTGCLIIATGLFKENNPGFDGVDFCESYADISVNPDDYKNKRVLIIGKGNSAFETAKSMLEKAASVHLCSPHPVKLAWQTHFVGNLRAVNNTFLDTYQLKSQNVVLDAEIISLEKNNSKIIANIKYTHAMGETRQIEFDKVILATGFKFDDSIFEPMNKPETVLNGKLPKLTSSWESTNVPDMYFAGTLMQYRDYKKTMSSFIHGFRYNIKILYRILSKKYDNEEWPMEDMENEPDVIASHILHRLNCASSIFLQPGFIGDLLLVNEDNDLKYVQDIPVEYIPDCEFSNNDSWFLITLEYGDFSKVRDPFAIERFPVPDKAHLVEYLHPIIRHYRKGKMKRELHLLEDLENHYSFKVYGSLLKEFFNDELQLSVFENYN